MRALISVSDKTGIVPFSKGLVKAGYEIVSTGGTLKVLQENGIKAIPIDDVTGFPEMLDGRVKTLHPKIHGGLLAVRDNNEHMSTCKAHEIELIDLVVVNLYPFEKTVAKPDVTLEEAIENIDIGGPSMLRSAAKNYRSVGVVVNPKKYDTILSEIQENKGALTDSTLAELACETFSHTAKYDTFITNYLERELSQKSEENATSRAPLLHKLTDLRYGENPHQKAAFYKLSDGKGLGDYVQLHGKELSYNNIIDLEAAALIVNDFDTPGAAIIKHTNPCGAAIGTSLAEAYQKAHDADSVSAFGSIVGLNRQVDQATAEALSKTFVEAVIAPSFDQPALDILTKKPSIRLIEFPYFKELAQRDCYKYVDGGFLVQSPDNRHVTADEVEVVTTTKPSAKQLNDLIFAFSMVKFVKSNAILVAANGQTMGVGAGQMSRVEAVEIALKKAEGKSEEAVLASDAFFPFKDSVELAAKSGIKAIIQPGGSKRDQESIDACNEHGIAMVFTGIRHFRH